MSALLLLPLVMLAASLAAQAAHQVPPPPSLLNAYGEVARLGAQGVNVSLLVSELNKAINLTQAGEGNASAIIDQVMAQLPAAEASANGVLARKAVGIAAAAAVIAAAALIYAKRREVIGGLWLRLRSGDSVKAGPGKPSTLLFNEEAMSIVAALLIVLAVFIAAQSAVSGRSSSFSAIALLGPSGKIGGYPSTIPVNSSPRLYLYVYNHVGEPAWYVVNVYLLNASTQPPLNAPPLISYERILPYNQSWIAPLTVPPVREPGSYRLVAQLWMYSPSNLTLTYTGDYVQLYFNATVS